MVRRYVLALGGDASAVDDMTQEVFLRALERLDWLGQHPEPARALRGIARRVSLEHLRRRRRDARRIVASTLELLRADGLGITSRLIESEQLDRLRREIDDLPIVARRMLELRYAEEWSSERIGEHLGIAPGAVRVTLLRIRARLHARLDSSPAIS